ncbi:Cir-N domain-containing protein [Fusarium sp. Ph1]|nr:Cir-N domain-containing protein [Fusarium sp. Ph1]
MPLHLLGKKSWNVYNADNIARVRRDEAAAKAAEEAEEQRMQETDAQRRLAILRGEAPPLIEDAEPSTADEPPARENTHSGSMRRKRKRPGEDDTDFEMRVARERDNMAVVSVESERKPTSSAPIVDHAGHIDLFGDEKLRAHAEKNEEAEKEAKKKKQSYEDQYTMRFSNAAGKDGALQPWYSQSDAAAPDASSKDVWGNQDPKRKERDIKRIVSNDPLAMMKQGASKVRELKQERKRFQEERDEELKQMRREDRHRVEIGVEAEMGKDLRFGMRKGGVGRGIGEMTMTVTEDLRDGGMIVIGGRNPETGGITETIMIRIDRIQMVEGEGEAEATTVVKEETRDLQNEIKASDVDIVQEKKHDT